MKVSLGCMLLLLIGLGGCRTAERAWFGAQYDADPNSVFIDPKPHDCEWDVAPLGNKLCRYRRDVRVENAAGQQIDGTDVRRGKTDGGQRMISYDGRIWFSEAGFSEDGGKTWTWRLAGDGITDWKPAKVHVSWQKVSER